ncbi:FISUMP domain-containing protein [Aureispira anguillae]|uniref:T9SS type A sorting domain-containing protein n=1 Tax=Aureispira anguillae TaxID=2864201 RepID=A0A915VKH4_9BACT|nr:FISUMP domain-containing protein [Aureispira anguillae]BDS09687.1 T9SS type A sorting domain-containing protein [Aureispira anguillae]
MKTRLKFSALSLIAIFAIHSQATAQDFNDEKLTMESSSSELLEHIEDVNKNYQTYNTTSNSTCPSSILDSRDNESYAVVQIGNKCWFAEDLNYNTPGSRPNSQLAPGSGRLYHWSEVMNNYTSSGARGACPYGWHVPTDAEWNDLEIAVGLNASDATQTGNRGSHAPSLKSVNHWPSGAGTNSSGFNVEPNGYYGVISSSGAIGYGSHGDGAYYWTSTTGSNSSWAWGRSLYLSNSTVRRSLNLKTHNKYSCRCVSNNTVVAVSKVAPSNVSEIEVYPNPTTGRITIDLKEETGEVFVQVFSVSGQLVYEAENVQGDSHQLELNQPEGIYFVEVTTTEGKERFKVVKLQ